MQGVPFPELFQPLVPVRGSLPIWISFLISYCSPKSRVSWFWCIFSPIPTNKYISELTAQSETKLLFGPGVYQQYLISLGLSAICVIHLNAIHLPGMGYLLDTTTLMRDESILAHEPYVFASDEEYQCFEMFLISLELTSPIIVRMIVP